MWGPSVFEVKCSTWLNLTSAYYGTEIKIIKTHTYACFLLQKSYHLYNFNSKCCNYNVLTSCSCYNNLARLKAWLKLYTLEFMVYSKWECTKKSQVTTSPLKCFKIKMFPSCLLSPQRKPFAFMFLWLLYSVLKPHYISARELSIA